MPSTQPSHRRSPSLLGLIAIAGLCPLALLAAGCGSDPMAPSADGAPTASFFDVGVQPVELDRSVKSLAEYHLTSNQPKRSSIRTDEGKSRIYAIAGAERKDTRYAYGVRMLDRQSTFTIPMEAFGDPSVAASITTIQPELYCPGNGDLRVTAMLLDEEGKVLQSTNYKPFRRSKIPHKPALQLPKNQRVEGAASISFLFTGQPGNVSIAGVELQRATPGAELPSLSAPELITLKGSSRLAGGLVEGHPWEGTFSAQPNSFIRLSVHTPLDYVRGAGLVAALRIDIEDGDETRALTVRMPAEAKGIWHDVKLPLDVKEPSEVTIRLTCFDDKDEIDSALLVGDLSIVTPKLEPKTVLLITSDTHRADYLGIARGRAAVLTPAIDKLAARGVWFRDCQSTTNTTTPSHVAIMTGINPKDTGIVDNVTKASERASTLAEAFRGAGYRTLGAVSVPHLIPSRSGLGQGFDRFSDPLVGTRAAHLTIESLTAWLDDAEGEDTFLWLHLFDAHTPYDPPNRTSRVSEGEPAVEITPELIEVLTVPTWLQNIETTGVDEVRGWYGQEVEALDRSLGKMLDHARISRGWVAFTSDHGENLGEHRAWFKHSGLFQPVLQVPLIIAGPGVEPGVSDAQVQQYSAARTLLDLTSIDVDFPGQNVLEASTADEPRFALGAYGSQASISLGKWLLVLGLKTTTRNPGEPFYMAGRVRLFDRTLGISTEEDFVDAEPEIARKLRASLIRWLESSADAQPLAETVAVTDAERKELEELGYSGGDEKPVTTWWDESRITDPRWKDKF